MATAARGEAGDAPRHVKSTASPTRSSVRNVPCRLPRASVPGVHSTGGDMDETRTDSESGVKPPARPPSSTYRSCSSDVVTVTLLPPPGAVPRSTVNAGTAVARWMTFTVARSSHACAAWYSMRITRAVKTVKRALPSVTTAAGSATGLNLDGRGDAPPPEQHATHASATERVRNATPPPQLPRALHAI